MDLATFRRLDNANMNSPFLIQARFHLAQFIDWCLHLGTLTRERFHSSFRAVFKDTIKRPRIFAFSNLFFCSVTLVYFIFGWSWRYLGIKRAESQSFRCAFFMNLFLEWTIAFGLIYAYTKGDSRKCQLWCLFQTVLILFHLLLTLAELVTIAWPGLLLIFVMCTIKLFGLWVMYYHSLELKSAFLSTRNRRRRDEDGMKISYFASAPSLSKIPGKKGIITRRGTDQTSIASSGPPSPSSPSSHPFDDIDDQPPDEFQRRPSTSISMSPPPPEYFQFLMEDNSNNRFSGEPQYSEIMVEQGRPNDNVMQNNGFLQQPDNRKEVNALDDNIGHTTQFSKENMINSGLMCGGSSSINMGLV